jgi:hypothetical protein
LTTQTLLLYGLAAALSATTTLDRIVAVVGKRAIKQSDIERDIRVTQFLNNAPPAPKAAEEEKQSLERLIDQELIRADMAAGGNTGHLADEAKALYTELQRDRFGGSKQKLEAELGRRGLSESQLLQQLQWQLVVLRFIDQRFRPGVMVQDDEVRRYYDKHRKELAPSNGDKSFESLGPGIRQTLEGEAINRNFEEWLKQTRKAMIIQYKVEALK